PGAGHPAGPARADEADVRAGQILGRGAGLCADEGGAPATRAGDAAEADPGAQPRPAGEVPGAGEDDAWAAHALPRCTAAGAELTAPRDSVLSRPAPHGRGAAFLPAAQALSPSAAAPATDSGRPRRRGSCPAHTRRRARCARRGVRRLAAR